MGTNFYFADRPDDPDLEDDPRYHIGKRSAAGLYCWDCEAPLPYRTELIGGHPIETSVKACPRCGKEHAKEGLEHSAPGRELGFNKSKPKPKTGVASCSWFSWACTDEDLERRLTEQIITVRKPIVDEYGRGYTVEEFRAVLSECPIQKHHLVGKVFC